MSFDEINRLRSVRPNKTKLTVGENRRVTVASPVTVRPPDTENVSFSGFVQMLVTGDEVRSGADPWLSRPRLPPEVDGRLLPPLKDIIISSAE